MDMRMVVATHKAAPVPTDEFYLPVHVGHALNRDDLGFQADDDGENISAANPLYCELTALYWAWRNLDADVVGLSHYRRYFAGTQVGPAGSQILSAAEAAELMDRHDVVLGSPRHYVVETIESHYRHAHHGEDLDALRAVVRGSSPAMVPAFERVFGSRSLSLYNMFLMPRGEFDSYAGWLFPILEQVADRIDGADRTSYQRRTLGFLGERLLNVWVAGRPQLRVARRKVVNVEGERILPKGVALLKRKVGLVDAAGRTS